jgi:hypothetical protein
MRDWFKYARVGAGYDEQHRQRREHTIGRAPTPELRHQLHVALGNAGKCDDRCTHEPYPPCPVCGEPA